MIFGGQEVFLLCNFSVGSTRQLGPPIGLQLKMLLFAASDTIARDSGNWWLFIGPYTSITNYYKTNSHVSLCSDKNSYIHKQINHVILLFIPVISKISNTVMLQNSLYQIIISIVLYKKAKCHNNHKQPQKRRQEVSSQQKSAQLFLLQ